MPENLYEQEPCNYCDSNTHSRNICPKEKFAIAEVVYEKWRAEVLEERRCWKLGIKYKQGRV